MGPCALGQEGRAQPADQANLRLTSYGFHRRCTELGVQVPGSGPRLRLAGPLPACSLCGPVCGHSMFRAPGLGAGGGTSPVHRQQAGGVGPARRLPLGDSTEMSVPAKFTAQRSPFMHILCTHSWVRGRVPSFRHGNGKGSYPASSSGRGGCAGARASLQDRPGILVQGASCACPRPAATESAAGRLQTTEVPCLPGLRAGRPGPGCCGAVCSVGPSLSSLPASPSPGGGRLAWRSLDGTRPAASASAFSLRLSAQADLPGAPGVLDGGPPCSDATSPYLMTSAVSRPRSQVLGVRASTCLLLRGIEFNP